MAAILTTGDFAASAQRHSRALTIFVGASVLLHAAVIVVLPKWIRADVRPVPLEVTLERIEPPRPLPMAPREPPREEKRPREKPKPVPVVQPKPQPQPPQPLALPPQPNVPEPVFTVPVPEARPAPEPQAAAPPDSARAVAKGDGEPSGKLTPPVFNAAYLRNPEPAYPVSSRRRGEQGVVVLKVLVTREGAAASVNVEKTSGHTALDQAAQEAVRKWRFAPARRGTEAIESSVLVPIVFRLEGAS